MTDCLLAQSMHAARMRAGLSLSNAAERLGVSISLLSRYESGTRFLSAAQIKRLSEILLEALKEREKEEKRIRKSVEFELSVPELATKFRSMHGEAEAE